MNNEEIFNNYKMVKMNTHMNDAFLENVTINKFKEVLSGDYNNEMSFGIRKEKMDENTYKGFLKTVVECRSHDTNSIELHIEVIYSGLFKANEEHDNSNMEEWVEAQIAPQLISYSRSIITHLTSLMSLPPIVLPTMDVIKSLETNGQLSDDK